MSTRLLDESYKDQLSTHVRIHRLVVRVDGITHEIIKIDGNLASVTFACAPRLAVLVDPNTFVYDHGEIDVDCMSCLVVRSWL